MATYPGGSFIPTLSSAKRHVARRPGSLADHAEAPPIPVPPTPPLVVGVTVTPTTLNVAFNHNLIVEALARNPWNWSISTGPGITGVSTPDQTHILLQVHGQIDGTSYRLNIPDGGIIDALDLHLAPPLYVDFTGTNPGPSIVGVAVIDTHHLDLIFSRPVLQVDALDPTKYSINPTLGIDAVTYITDYNYRLYTSRQVANLDYTVTPLGIRAIDWA